MMHGVSMVLLQFKRMELLQQVARVSTLHGALLEVAMHEQHGAPLLRRRDAEFLLARVSTQHDVLHLDLQQLSGEHVAHGVIRL